MSAAYDVIVVGVGAMGSAAAYHLVRAGQRVLAIDRFTPPHTLGSSHGQTRIIREAYFEHPAYVPLIQRAYELWTELERNSGKCLFKQTGGLMIGRPGSEVYEGARRSAEQHHLSHQILTASEVRRQFPALQPAPEMMAVWEPRAGILFPESCVATHIELAQKSGARFLFNTKVDHWEPVSGRVRVRSGSDVFEANNLVITAGPWVTTLLPELSALATVERQVQFWFKPARAPEQFAADRCPIHLWETPQGHHFYGFPDLGDGVKVARHHDGQVTTPDRVQRDVLDEDVDGMREIVQEFLPAANGSVQSTAVCLYTNFPDGHFLIDTHPEYPQVVIASPCSGHGFKFSTAVGQLIADAVCGRHSAFDLELFRLNRFKRRS